MISILLVIKILLFVELTNVINNRFEVVLISSLISFLIFSLIYHSKLKHKNAIALAFYAFSSILMFIDAMYFAQFNQLTSIKLITLIPLLSAVGDCIKSLFSFKLFTLILDIPILIFLSYKSIDIDKPIPKRPLAIGLILLVIMISYSKQGKLDSVVAQEVFLYHFNDIVNSSINNEDKVEAAEVFTSDDLQELKERAEFKGSKYNGIGKGKNLIVIQVEALQNFVINLNYNGQEVTPNLNKLIMDKSSIYYDNYYQLLGRGNTSDAEFVTHNSLYPSMEEPTYTQYEKNTFYGLPWLLRDNNYTCWAFHGYKKDYWNRANAYVNQGFQRFISQEDFTYEDTIGFGIKDEDFFIQSLEYIKELDELNEHPFYAFMVTLTSHTPFNMPEEYQVLEIKEEHKDTLLGNYLQAIHYTDKAIGMFIEGLKQEGLYDNTVLAIYGDHFAVLSTQEKEQKIMSDFLGENYDFDNMMNVPLIITVPGEEINEVVSVTGSHLDFYPTIANIMGYKNKKGLVFGVDLNNHVGKNYVYQQTYMLKGSIIDDESVFVFARDGIYDHSRAYDINTKESLDINMFKDQYQKAIAEIEKSNYILENNLLKDLVENSIALTGRNMYLVAHAGGELDGHTYTNSKDALDLSYENGIRLMEVDFEWTRDNRLVCVHSWDGFINKFFNVEVNRYTYDEFKNFTMINNWTQLTPDILSQWMETHHDAYIVTDIKSNNIEGLRYLSDTFPHLINRIIPQIYKPEEYEPVKELGYENIIFTLYLMRDKEEILDFEHLDELLAVTMPEATAHTDLPKKLNDRGVYVYAHTINDMEKVSALIENGVSGFYTDSLMYK
jgi:phosphoglycerol transferase MdoB-like AlkP superfamily enzyme